MSMRKSVVICGAGIAGISAAYFLARRGVHDILLVDERPPLSLTSDKSTECYRNWWPGPGPAMVQFMNRSIDLLQELARESGNVFHLNQRGYLYATARPQQAAGMLPAAQAISTLGGGPLRVYHSSASKDAVYQPAAAESFEGQPDGADLFLDPALIRQHFPYLHPQTCAALHARRAGWFSAQQLGMYLLEQARSLGVELLSARLAAVETSGGRVQAVTLADGQRIECETFVNAAGPFLQSTARMLGLELPVYNELHLKASIRDTAGAVPRHAPLVIWNDPQTLPWSDAERELLADDPETRPLLAEMPGGAHTRPEGGAGSPIIVLLWEYKVKKMEPTFPLPLDPQYPELALRGMATAIPALAAYIGKLSRPCLDGGYYTRTPENRPLIGPLPLSGAYVIGALSGYGLMAACAAGDLLAAHICNLSLPEYAPAFELKRYQDPAYQQHLQRWGETGQL